MVEYERPQRSGNAGTRALRSVDTAVAKHAAGVVFVSVPDIGAAVHSVKNRMTAPGMVTHLTAEAVVYRIPAVLLHRIGFYSPRIAETHRVHGKNQFATVFHVAHE